MNTGSKTLLAALFASAALTASAAQTTADARTETQTPTVVALVHAAMGEYFSLWSTKRSGAFGNAFSENAALKYSLSIPEVSGVIEGRDSLANQVHAVAQLGFDWKFEDLKLFATNDPNTYFVQYTARATLRSTGEKFERPAIVVVETDGAKVTTLQELSNPAIAESTLAGESMKKLARARE